MKKFITTQIFCLLTCTIFISYEAFASSQTCTNAVETAIEAAFNNLNIDFNNQDTNSRVKELMQATLSNVMENNSSCSDNNDKIGVNNHTITITKNAHTFNFTIQINNTEEETLPEEYEAPQHTKENDQNGTYGILFSPQNSTQTIGEPYNSDSTNNKVFWNEKCSDHTYLMYFDDTTDINNRIHKSQMAYDDTTDYFLNATGSYLGLLMSDRPGFPYPVRQQTETDIHNMALWLTKLLEKRHCAGLNIYTVLTEQIPDTRNFRITKIVGGPYPIPKQ